MEPTGRGDMAGNGEADGKMVPEVLCSCGLGVELATAMENFGHGTSLGKMMRSGLDIP